MLKVTPKIEGLDKLNRKINSVAKKVKDPKPMITEVAFYLLRSAAMNMARGVDADGRPLAPVEKWTRRAGLTTGSDVKGKPVPLKATGGMSRALNVWGLSSSGAEVGWKGKYLKRVIQQTNGTAGRMRIKATGIRGKYSGIKKGKTTGKEYVRIKGRFGWFTKRVKRGSITIKPKARRFFYLSKKQQKRAGEIADKYIAKAVG